ncbi:YiiD C-terminal domain-containing protein [Thiohalophilus sp.]|uniref:YiiD C-terminal domain-containing protein n=1 Tax=Thiohalophilus sp. TaxID=3028392 RepID=UPI002ACDC628|nr:YiiD C-terminal domain-containing protein [Thiohalophilus sp.]MDZ7663152.1 YiiD C-terminal domain-containing protein [Thiohalophilus sp.]
MLPDELEHYLHEHIPLSKAMAVSVVVANQDEVVLSAPLAPNINHRETVFGGSASALATLAAWSLLHLRLRADGFSSRLVIQRNTMDYDLPIDGSFTARASVEWVSDWSRFIRMLSRKGRARISVASVLEYNERVAGRFCGEFVALDGGTQDN